MTFDFDKCTKRENQELKKDGEWSQKLFVIKDLTAVESAIRKIKSKITCQENTGIKPKN